MVRVKAQVGELRGSVFRDGELVAKGQMRFVIANAQYFMPGGKAS